MAKAKNVTTSVENIFSTSKSSFNEYVDEKDQRYKKVSIDKLKAFPNHPFRVIDDDLMERLVESIKTYGLQEPLLVVRDDESDEESYYIISGHRRKRAYEKIGWKNIPVYELKIDKNKAIILMVDSNNQRRNLLPSEKAKAYRLKADALGRKQGQRTDLFDDISNAKLKELVNDNEDNSEKTIQRYIRLSYLNDELLTFVDEKKINMVTGYTISFFSEKEQTLLLDYIKEKQVFPSKDQIIRMRELKGDEELSLNIIQEVFNSEKKPVKKNNLTIKEDNLYQYFPVGTEKKQMENTINKLLDMWKKGLINIEENEE